MSVCTKGFITLPSGNPTEALNKAVYALVRLCSQNNLLHKNRHPFRLKSLQMGSSECFFIVFQNDREDQSQLIRNLQIGTYEDQVKIHPKGAKISLSIGAQGDSEFIIKQALKAALTVCPQGEAWFQATDFNDEFTCLKTDADFEVQKPTA